MQFIDVEAQEIEDQANADDARELGRQGRHGTDNRGQARHWVFTINNPTQADRTALETVACRWIVWQFERGTNGTLHAQGTISFNGRQRRGTVVRELGGRAWVSIRRGSEEQAIDYCEKEDGRVEGPFRRGAVPEPGRQHPRGQRLVEACRIAQEPDGIRRLIDQDVAMYVLHARALIELHNRSQPDRTWQTQAVVFWGGTGTGKSHRAKTEFPGAFWLARGNTNVWWDGYDGHDTVVIDEFDSWMPITLLLRVLDHTPLSVDTKRGLVPFRAKTVVFCSNINPEHWYPGAPESQQAALRRRLGRIEHMTTVYVA